MQELILYPYELNIQLENGVSLSDKFPDLAALDAELLQLWLYSKSEKTVIAYLRDVKEFYKIVGISFLAMDLRKGLAYLQQYNDGLLKKGLKSASRKRALATIKSLFSFGADLKYFDINPGTAYKLRKLEDRLAERIMSEQSMDDILERETNKRNHAMLTLLYYGGLRAAEVCNLKWRNLQERDNTGQIAVYGKGDEMRYVYLDSDTWQEVWALREKAGLDEYVFQSRQIGSRAGKQDNRLDESRVWQIVHAAGKRAGVAIDVDGESKVSPHWFRHSHATHAIWAGASITLVKDTLGHKSIETTAKYTHVRPNDSSAIVLRKNRKKDHGK